MEWIFEWVYDRTQDDVFRANQLNEKYMNRTITQEEIEEWKNNLKGALNASDLNRIEGNTAELARLTNVIIKTKQWTRKDIPRVSDFARIRENVKKIREAWYVLLTTPETPEIPLNEYKKLNDIERILHDIYYTYSRTVDYCGEFYAGEEIGTL